MTCAFRRLRALAVALSFGSLAITAQANTIQPLLVNTAPNGVNTDYTYALELTPYNGLAAGISFPSALVIADFPGVVGVTMSAAGGDLTATSDWSLFTTGTGAGSLPDWSLTSGTLNLNGFLGYVSTPDGADTNVILQYTGGGLPVALTQRPLLHLTVTSSATPAFQIVQSMSRNAALFVPNEVNTFPLLVAGGGAPTPEPATLGVLAIGAAGLLARRRRM